MLSKQTFSYVSSCLLQRTCYLCVHAGGHELVARAKEGMGCVYDPVKERGHSCTVLHNVESPC